MINLEKMGYSEEEIRDLSYSHYKTGLSFESLVILNQNLKAGNQEFIDNVNQFIRNRVKNIEEVESFIKENNPMNQE